MEKREPLHAVGGNASGATAVENSREVAPTTQPRGAVGSSNPISGYIAQSLEVRVVTSLLHPDVHAALFAAAKTWTQLRCQSMDELIRKMQGVHRRKYSSAVKGNSVPPHATAWMNPEDIVQSDLGLSEND